MRVGIGLNEWFHFFSSFGIDEYGLRDIHSPISGKFLFFWLFVFDLTSGENIGYFGEKDVNGYTMVYSLRLSQRYSIFILGNKIKIHTLRYSEGIVDIGL